MFSISDEQYEQAKQRQIDSLIKEREAIQLARQADATAKSNEDTAKALTQQQQKPESSPKQ